tara:strand:- start:10469 stop:11179 length:711 start_codon:yes stop_codon:yes gene_type:complete
MIKTFKHSGDLGDIIYSLPTIKALGGGVLYLDPTGGSNDPLVSWGKRVNTSLNEELIGSLKPLLEQQEYIKEIKLWDSSVGVDYNLNEFRNNLTNNLSDSHLKAFGLSSSRRDDIWLSIDEPLYHSSGRKTLMARSLRVHSNHSFWETLPDSTIEDLVFVGSKFEYEVFYKTFKYDIPFWDLSILDLARAIACCKLFISNQTFGSAIAEGFKKDLIQEVYRLCPLAIFQREGASYV